MMDLRGRRGGAYARVSFDKERGSQGHQGARSVREQLAGCEYRSGLLGVSLIERYADEHVSASDYATRQREDYPRMIADIERDHINMLFVFEPSRLSRDMVVWAPLIALCRTKGVLIDANGTTYDPRIPDHEFMLQMHFIMATKESRQTSVRITRAMLANATEGRPHGPIPFGYRREYDQRTGKLLAQVRDSRTEDYVRLIFGLFMSGWGSLQIASLLNKRNVPTSRQGARWYASAVTAIASNRAYIGERVHKGSVTRGIWEPIITDEREFWAVQRIIAGKKLPKEKVRGRIRNNNYLLSTLGRCESCEGPLSGHKRRDSLRYVCRYKGCSSVPMDTADKYVERVMVEFLSRPELFSQLVESDDRAILAAEADLEKATGEMEDLERQAEANELSPRMAGIMERGIQQRIDAAQAIINTPVLPEQLRRIVGPQAATEWALLDNLAKRQLIRLSMRILIRPNKIKRKRYPIEEKVVFLPPLRADAPPPIPMAAYAPTSGQAAFAV